MKVLHISTYDDFGGAAKAASRILHCENSYGIQAEMLTLVKQTDHPKVHIPVMNNSLQKIKFVRELIGSQRPGSNLAPGALRSSGLISAGIVDQINSNDCDIVHLHWIINMLSVEDIAAIRKPLVWTFHDLWPMCGTEHYIEEFEKSPYCVSSDYSLLSENKFYAEYLEAWHRKEKFWNGKAITIVGPSEWISGLVRKSRLFNTCTTYTIPLPIDAQNVWYPESRDELRRRFSLSDDHKVILCVAKDFFQDPRKGWIHLVGSITRLTQRRPVQHFVLMVAGPEHLPENLSLPITVRWVGNMQGSATLRQVYSMADVLAVPSRMEAFSLTSLEAQACGLPVVAFDNSGPAGIVAHTRTGWLAPAFETDEFAAGIEWITQDRDRWLQLSIQARAHALASFSPQIVAHQYSEVYTNALS
jgi:glycosyltransferase involved in cell wall biosynthesis